MCGCRNEYRLEMRYQKRDYDAALVQTLPKEIAQQIELDDPVPIFDNTEAFKDQLAADKDHPAYGLDEVDDEAD